MVNGVYQMTRFGALSKDYGLCSQIQRAAVSVMSNVAEGFERHHAGEKKQAYNIARGSAAEVRSLLYVVKDNYPEEASEIPQLQVSIVTIGRLIGGLIKSTHLRHDGP